MSEGNPTNTESATEQKIEAPPVVSEQKVEQSLAVSEQKVEAPPVVSEKKIEAAPAVSESLSCRWFNIGCKTPPVTAPVAGGSKRKQKTSKRMKKGGRKTHKKQKKNTINKKGGRKIHRKTRK